MSEENWKVEQHEMYTQTKGSFLFWVLARLVREEAIACSERIENEHT